jgi:flagellar biosynthesis protein FlhF
MKIKRYMVNSMKEACELIREDLGPDAVIVSNKKVRERGIKGLFSKRKLEVTAAIDEENSKNFKNQNQKNLQDNQKKEVENDYLMREIGQIKKILQKKSQKEINVLEEKENSALYLKYKDILENIEIEKEIICDLMKNIEEHKIYNEFEFREILFERSKNIFKPVTRENQKSNILAFVGPPGVGKTTTLAKLGAQFALFNNLNIGLITIDTYRIGAVQQLQTYGEIMGVSVEVVMTPGEFKRAVEKNRKKDLVLVDTAGRPSKNSSQIAELKTYLDAAEPIDVYLVLSSETKNKDMMRMLNDYKILNYSKLIFTKTDETESLGSIINAAYKTGMPVAYITNGQNVPDDIEAGNPESLVKLILRDVNN